MSLNTVIRWVSNILAIMLLRAKRFILGLIPFFQRVKDGISRFLGRFMMPRRRIKKYDIVSPYCSQLVDAMEDKALELAPKQQYITERNRATDIIFGKLKKDGKKYNLKIGRTIIAGSFGKGTAIVCNKEDETIKKSDLDLVVYVNDEQPPFTQAYKNIKSLLEDIPEVVKESIRVKQRTIGFFFKTAQGQIEVDLLASENLVKDTSNRAGQDIGDIQQARASRQLQARPVDPENNLNRIHSSAFAEASVTRIDERVQNPFNGKVVRLAKYWSKNLKFGPNLRARSCMIEVIALHAQKRKRRGRRRYKESCVVCGFRRFLEAVSQLKSVHISIDKTDENVSVRKFPMVVDPANPMNNLAEGINSNVLNILIDQAEKTLAKIESFKRSAGYESVENPIDEIFSHKE